MFHPVGFYNKMPFILWSRTLFVILADALSCASSRGPAILVTQSAHCLQDEVVAGVEFEGLHEQS
jgi:hypothetical protein